MTPPVVLAYSGGLQAMAALRWLQERRRADVVTVSVDIGQPEDLAGARERALAAGALRGHVVDAREEFVRDAVIPSIRAAALSDGRYPMATGLGRPIVAERLVDLARIEGGLTVAHGCVGRDGPRFEALVHALDPKLTVVACAAEHGLFGAELAAYAGEGGEPANGVRVDENLWGRTTGRSADDPSQDVPEQAYARTNSLARCPDQPAIVAISFVRGAPSAINGLTMGLTELTDSLSTIAAEHGVGRLDRVKQRADGRRTRVVYESPAAVVLHRAHHDLLRLAAPPPVVAFSRTVSPVYAELVGGGGWFGPLRRALDGFVERANERATGIVRLRLFKGSCEVVGRSMEPSSNPG